MGDGAVRTAPPHREGLKAIVFDLDGTLYQDERLGEQVNLSACRYISSLKGVSVEEADLLLKEARCTISGSGGTLSASVLALGGNLEAMHDAFNTYVQPEGLLKVDPRVVALLKALARRYELYLYTNNNHKLSARIMEEIGITGLFLKVFTVQDYWRPKPDETALLGILEAIDKKPEETLFVGDRYDVDLALPASLGAAVFEAKTVDELLELAQLIE